MKTLEEMLGRLAAGAPCALATVVSTEGSSPAQPAMRMLVGPEGRVAGTVGGGRVEVEVEQGCLEALRTGKARLMSFTLDDDLADEGGLMCGGTVRILVERVDPPAGWATHAIEILRQGRRGVLLTRPGERVERVVLSGEAAAPYLGDETPRMEGEHFVEPLFRPRCVVMGAGHVGRAVARVAAEAGFAVAVIDDREEQVRRAAAERIVCADWEEGLARLEPGPDDYVVVTTRGHGTDLRSARAALRSPARYVGMLASRKKTAAISETLRREGVALERLHAPIGLDLGAVSAGEIAVSVVAQMIKVRRRGRGDR